MKKTFLLVVLLGLMSLPSMAQTVSGSISNGRVSKGKTVRGVVTLNIPKGLHVNSYKPNSKYAVPTTVTLTSPDGRVYGLTYPAGKSKKFGFSDSPISVYENRASFGFKFAVPSRYSRKTVRVKAVVRYQACTDEVCYAPKSKTIWITAVVR
ncbi:MAG: protein-disulfide reductase DsbD family protein [Pyrinomonadaceae bacterium]